MNDNINNDINNNSNDNSNKSSVMRITPMGNFKDKFVSKTGLTHFHLNTTSAVFRPIALPFGVEWVWQFKCKDIVESEVYNWVADQVRETFERNDPLDFMSFYDMSFYIFKHQATVERISSNNPIVNFENDSVEKSVSSVVDTIDDIVN